MKSSLRRAALWGLLALALLVRPALAQSGPITSGAATINGARIAYRVILPSATSGL